MLLTHTLAELLFLPELWNVQLAATLGTGNIVLGDTNTANQNIALYLDNARTIFTTPIG